eukprot:COSAG06_NODE_1065_length_10861_cov_34.653224_3_plen_118_part_00
MPIVAGDGTSLATGENAHFGVPNADGDGHGSALDHRGGCAAAGEPLLSLALLGLLRSSEVVLASDTSTAVLHASTAARSFREESGGVGGGVVVFGRVTTRSAGGLQHAELLRVGSRS